MDRGKTLNCPGEYGTYATSLTVTKIFFGKQTVKFMEKLPVTAWASDEERQ